MSITHPISDNVKQNDRIEKFRDVASPFTEQQLDEAERITVGEDGAIFVTTSGNVTSVDGYEIVAVSQSSRSNKTTVMFKPE